MPLKTLSDLVGKRVRIYINSPSINRGGCNLHWELDVVAVENNLLFYENATDVSTLDRSPRGSGILNTAYAYLESISLREK